MPVTTSVVIDYFHGLGGRAEALPGYHLDAVAEALLDAHPSAVHRRDVIYTLVSGKFRRSRHRLLAGIDLEQAKAHLHEYQRKGVEDQRRYRQRVYQARAAAGITSKTHKVSNYRSVAAIERLARREGSQS